VAWLAMVLSGMVIPAMVFTLVTDIILMELICLKIMPVLPVKNVKTG
jgi:hypothetical protein